MQRFTFLNEKQKVSILDYDPFLKSDKFRALFDNHPDAIFALDAHGNVLNLNNSVKNIFGFTLKDLRKNYDEFFTAKYVLKRKKYFQLALLGSVQNFQAVVYHKNRQRKHVDITYIPIFNNERETVGIYGIAKDITKNISNEKELKKMSKNLEQAQRVAKIGSWDYDIIENEAFWSNQMFDIYDMKNSLDFVPTQEGLLELIFPEDRDYVKNVMMNAINNRESYALEYRIMRKDGSITYAYEKADIILDENQTPIRVIGTLQDITNRKTAEIKLIEHERRFQNIYNNLEVGIWSFDVRNKEFILISPGVEKVSGYSANDFHHKITWESLIHPNDLTKYKKAQPKLRTGESIYHHYRIIHKNCEIVWVQDQTIPVMDHHGKLIRIDGIVSNITDQKEKEYKIKQLAYHDDISELPNRRMFDKKVKSLIESSNNNKQIFTFLKLNIDRFKNINTSLGHRIANNLLKQFGERIKNLLPESSLLARISGDYFGILLWDYHQSDAPEALAKSVIESMKQPFFVGDYELFVTTSIGISTFPSNGENIVELEKCAELALSHAKEIGINNYQLYSPSLAIKSNKLYSLEKDLRKAIENEELILHFQPRVEPNTEKIVGAEALIRWEHPVMGLVSPNEFIPLAEEIGFIDTIGDWVIKQVCQSINKWKKKGVKIVPISINISAQRFLKSDWKKFIHIILEETNMNPSMLELEITETTLIRHEEAVYSAIQFLKELGIKIALDDFGTGYSSLTHLRQYPIDTIKIDKSFIDNITKEESEAVIAKSILYLSKGLNINVVAEGVETIEQLTFLKEHECKEIQGYIFSKPVSEKEFLRLLNIIQLKPTYQETY